MAYNTIEEVIGEISGEVLLQLINDSSLAISFDLVQAVLDGGDLSAVDADEVSAAAVAANTLNKVLTRASAEVDGYCSNLYSVPFAQVPPFVSALDLDVAIYHLFSRRENVPENRLNRYKNAVKSLSSIAKGEIQLGVTGLAAPEQKGQLITVSSPPEKIFTMERLRNF